MDEASSLNAMGYYLGRKTEYKAMYYLNNTLYPTYPKWQILNASILPELYGMWTNLIGGYSESMQDAVRYAQVSFVGEISALDLKADSTSLKTGDNDLVLVWGAQGNSAGAHGYTNHTLGYIYINGTNADNFLWVNAAVFQSAYVRVYFEDQLTANNTMVQPSTGTRAQVTLTTGLYKVILEEKAGSGDDYLYGFYTDALIVQWDFATMGSEKIFSLSRGLYTTLNFIDTNPTTYTIDIANTTDCYMNTTRATLATVINFANALSNAYWTVLRNAEIYDISDIPPNLVIPLPDFAFISNEDMLDLNEYEIMAMYLMYMKALGEFFNSSTYQTIQNTSFSYMNVTFANIGVVVDGFLYRDEALYTNGSLYFQIAEDMCFELGNNTINASGLVYNLNTSSVFTYAPGDIVNATAIRVRASNGTYYSATNACIIALTIVAYLFVPEETPAAETTGSGGGGGGGGGGLLIIIAILVLLLIARGNAKGGSGNPINVIMPKSKAVEHRPAMQHFAFMP